MWLARVRLASLWGSQTARVTADHALRLYIVLDFAGRDVAHQEVAWHIVTLILMVPFLLFAPLNGALCNALPKPTVLAAAAAASSLIIAAFAWADGNWLVGWALVAVTAALYSPARYALLPAGSEDARTSLPRVTGVFEAGAFVATISGLLLGGLYVEDLVAGYPAPVLIALVLSILTFLLALPVRFASDVRRPEPPLQAVAGFFRDCRRIWRTPEARFCLLGMAAFRGLITGMTGAVLADTLAAEQGLTELLRDRRLRAGRHRPGLAAGRLAKAPAPRPGPCPHRRHGPHHRPRRHGRRQHVRADRLHHPGRHGRPRQRALDGDLSSRRAARCPRQRHGRPQLGGLHRHRRRCPACCSSWAAGSAWERPFSSPCWRASPLS